jgi:hypothetical protein
MSAVDWTLLLIAGFTVGAVILAAGILWFAAQAAYRLAQWLRQ